MGFDAFGKACFDGGVIRTFLEIAKSQSPKTDKWRGLAVHFALQTFWMLMRMGTAEERRELLKELLDNDAIMFCLDVRVSFISGRHLGLIKQPREPLMPRWSFTDKMPSAFCDVYQARVFLGNICLPLRLRML